MSKASGSTKLLTPKQRQIDKARNEYNQIVSSSLVDASLSYFSEQTGAHAIFMKGHNHTDKIADAEAELEVARAIADNGINITLTPEGDKYTMYATNVKINKDGTKKYKFSEGIMATYTFEQKTPTEITTSAANLRIISLHCCMFTTVWSQMRQKQSGMRSSKTFSTIGQCATQTISRQIQR